MRFLELKWASVTRGFALQRCCIATAIAIVFVSLSCSKSLAGMIESNSPILTESQNDVRSRIRWGGTNWEAGILKTSTPSTLTDVFLNPSGTPVWQQGQDYKFRILYTLDYLTEAGNFDLEVDFNADGDFNDASEKATMVTSLLGGLGGNPKRYYGIQISGNESGSPGRSIISDLVINGTSVSGITPAGALVNKYYTSNVGLMSVIDITGTLKFTDIAGIVGTERPVYNFVMQTAVPQTAVPEPTSMVVFGTILSGFCYRRYRNRVS
jgi:hypothetical protein